MSSNKFSMRTLQRIRALRKNGQHEAALALSAKAASQQPHHATLQYEAACVHDYLGRGAAAIPYYRAALAGALPQRIRQRAYLGLCSTYRARGFYRDALATAEEGLAIFPDSAALRVFRAMTLYNLGQCKTAMGELMDVLCKTSTDPEIRGHKAAIDLYAQDLDRRWL